MDIVRDDGDRHAFVELLARTVLARGWLLHAWVLMTNHLHLLLETPVANLSEGMHDLLGDFASWFNDVHDRVGHLFQHRFDAKVVEPGRHQLELSRYLPLNPVRCGLVSTPGEWRWSSYRAIAGFEPAPPWLHTEKTLNHFDATDRLAAQMAFREYVSSARGIEYHPWAELTGGWILGSPEFCEAIQQWLDETPRSDEHPKRQKRIARPSFEDVVDCVAKELGVSDPLAARWSRDPVRKLIADLAHEVSGLPYREVGRLLGVDHTAAMRLGITSRRLEVADTRYAALAARIRALLG